MCIMCAVMCKCVRMVYFLHATNIGAYPQRPETEILTSDTISKQRNKTD